IPAPSSASHARQRAASVSLLGCGPMRSRSQADSISSTSFRSITAHPLPPRLVDGGSQIDARIGRRMLHTELIALDDANRSAVQPLRTLPRRFEGGGGFAE